MPHAGALLFQGKRARWPEGLFTEVGFAEARRAIAQWDGYRPTPVHELSGLALKLGVSTIFFKDEGRRFNLKSFKALGGAYAVDRLVAEHGRDITVTCATDGNHGRSVAWGASRAGCRCVIYIHEQVSEGRAEAIASFGAEVRRTGANYTASVRQAAKDAATHGWLVVSDTSYAGYTDVPKLVMYGYGVMADEALDELGSRPDFVLLQGGVGGLAAAVIARLHHRFVGNPPIVVIVEPDRAACLLASAKQDALTEVEIVEETVMAGLSCGEPSLIAWEIVKAGTDWFMAIPDHAAEETMRWLAWPGDGDTALAIGESGVASLAGLIALAASPANRERVGLETSSSILAFATEGATDPEIYKRIVGREAEEVEQAYET